MKVLEACLNELSYMAVKRYFLEPNGLSTREFDVERVMALASPDIKSTGLNLGQPAPQSKTRLVELESCDAVFNAALWYFNEHYCKLPGASKPSWYEEALKDWAEISAIILKMPPEYLCENMEVV